MHVKEAHQRHSLRTGRCCSNHKERAAGPCQRLVTIEMCMSRSTGCYCNVCVFFLWICITTMCTSKSYCGINVQWGVWIERRWLLWILQNVIWKHVKFEAVFACKCVKENDIFPFYFYCCEARPQAGEDKAASLPGDLLTGQYLHSHMRH